MADQFHNLTVAVTDLTTALTLTAATAYRIEVVGGGSVYVRVAAAAPAAGSDGRIVYPGPDGGFVAKAADGEAIYAWAPGGSARLALSEAP